MAGPFADLLASGPWAIDGGLASELEGLGHDLSGSLWSARLIRDRPEAIVAIHAAYYRAGAAVAISASYQASRHGFATVGIGPEEADELIARSVALAKEARDVVRGEGLSGPLLVAASVGPYGANLPDGGEYRGGYGLGHDELVGFHRERLEVLAAAAPDVFAVETIPDADEARAIAEALAAHPRIPAWISFACSDSRHTCAGDRFEHAVAEATAAPSVAAVGVNCTAPEYLEGLLEAARRVTGLPLVVYPNTGRTWDGPGNRWLGEGTDRLSETTVGRWADLGATLIGGCCGLGPGAVSDIDRVLRQRRTPALRDN
jgi:homocysteine S-methyltransferase